MEKTFRLVKVGDKIYQTTIEDSQVKKDAAGNASVEFIVKEIEEVDFYHRRLIMNKLKLKVASGGKFVYAETEETKNSVLIIEVENNSSLKTDSIGKEDSYGLTIDKIFYSPTKTSLKEHIFKIFNYRGGKAEILRNLCNKIISRLQVSAMEVGMINTADEEKMFEEMNEEMDLEMAASMAL